MIDYLPHDLLFVGWSSSAAVDCNNYQNLLFAPISSSRLMTTLIDTITGCAYRDSISVSVIRNKKVSFPPNSNGINDQWSVYTGPSATEISHLTTYYRWEGEIFSGPGTADWNGKIKTNGKCQWVLIYTG
jgi:hypothetical protein